jgi:hypothetical protein
VRRGPVDANVATILDGADKDEKFAGKRVPALGIHQVQIRERSTAHQDRDGVLPGLTRFQRDLSTVVVRNRTVVVLV